MLSKSLMAAGNVDKAWNLNNAAYLGEPQGWYTYEVPNWQSQSGLYLKPDGTGMYTIQNPVGTTDHVINEYSLSTPWDVTTATYVNSSPNLYSIDSAPAGLFFQPDGTRVFFTGDINDDVFSLPLTTPWDITTVNTASVTSRALNTTSPRSLFFSPDGLYMFVVSNSPAQIERYALSTAWNIGTTGLPQTFSTTGQTGYPYGVTLTPDGTSMYVLGSDGGVYRVYQYTLSTAWSLSSVTYVQNRQVTFAIQGSFPWGVAWNDDGTRLYVSGYYNVSQLSASTPYSVTSIPGTDYFPTTKYYATQEERNPNAIAFRPDGLRMYIVGFIADRVYEYTITTAWQVQYPGIYSLTNKSINDPNTTGLFFSPDGLKMYTIGTSFDSVHEYTLSTAWSVSTASLTRSQSVQLQTTSPYGLCFSPDGTKMYHTGSIVNNGIYEYTLSTAWNISTLTYIQNFQTSARGSYSTGVQFNPDGYTMYVQMGDTNKAIDQYTLSTAWDISTATYSGKSLVTGRQDASTRNFAFKPDGLSLFTVGAYYSAVFTYDFV